MDLAAALDPENFGELQGLLGTQAAVRDLQVKMMSTLMQIDKPGAMALLGEWSKYAETSAKTTDMEFHSFDEYLRHRYHEAAIPLYFEIQCFATGLRLSAATLQDIAPIVTPLGLSMALVNDYFSFDKEFVQFVNTGGVGQMYNAVAFLVKEKTLSVRSAKATLRAKIIDLENEFKRAWKSWLTASGERHVDAQRYLEYAALTAGGSAFWHAKAPRYAVESHPADENGAVALLRRDDECVTRAYHTLNKVKLRDSSRPAPRLPGLMSRTQPLHEPFEYMASLPSKNVRNMIADAFNIWLRVPEPRLHVIKAIVGMLHNASLMCVHGRCMEV
ncbi:Terpenoid synthase [Macrophomina phaseolina MS6]|uniref:Terpenoid synthase n=1 Tax=Macrophomina phaseolina (strain MS6) TaxID=1126212 RepID=K2RAT5_MACPH|nr:Terpenoid synthase [Macrophomina phaseolina MS6]